MIVILCGPPGVGKTTVASLVQERLRERGLSFQTLDSDEFSTDTYEQLFRRVRDSGGHWLVAGTFYEREWQVEFTRLNDVAFVYLRADLETCLERNRQREDPVTEEAVHVVYREFDEPDASLTVDVVDESPDEVADRILAALSLPESGESS